MFIWEWIYAKQIALRYTWGVLGGHKFKSGEDVKTARPNGIKFGTHVEIRPSIYHGALVGGYGATNSRLAPHLYTSVDSYGNEHRLNTICPTIPQGGIFGGF